MILLGSFNSKARSTQKVWIGFVAFSLVVVVGILTWLSESSEVVPSEAKAETKKSSSAPAPAKVENSPVITPVVPIAEREIWKLPTLTTEESQRQQQWLGRYAAARTDAERADLLSEAMASEELSVRMALVVKALQTGSQEVQIEALRSLVGVSGQAQMAAYKTALADEDAVVRDAALQIARDQEPEVRMPTFELALSSPLPEVRQQSFVELTREPGKAALEVFMRSLDTIDSSLRIQFWQHFLPQLQSLRETPFTSTAEAQEWWKPLSHRYDDHLNLTE
jgi:hypothetical protein